MLEYVFGVVVFLLLALILAAVAVAPVLAILSLNRLRRVERRLRLLEERGATPLMEALPVEVVEQPRPAAERSPRRRMTAARGIGVPEQDRVRIESFIGRRVLAWVAAALLVLAASFFLNYALQSKMIGPAGQIATVALVAAALCLWGFRRFMRGGYLTCQLLTGTGIVVLFLAVYASFSVYPLLTPPAAGAFLTILMSEAALLAVLYRSRAIAFLAVVGALLTPLLIRQEGDPYLSYFIYLLVLSFVVQGLFALRPWIGLRGLTLLGTQGLFWLWFLDRYHPDKATAVVAFQLLTALSYIVPDWFAAARRRSREEDWALQIVVPWFLFAALYRVVGEFHPAWMGSLALLFALVWTLFAVGATRPRFVSDPVRPLLLMATALALLGLSFPLQARAYWATVGWTAEGVALWWLGLRIRAPWLRGAGVAFLALALVGALFVMNAYAPEAPYLPIINRRTLTVLVVAGGLFTAAFAARRFLERLEIADQAVRYAAGLAGVALCWLVLSFEVWDGVRLFADPESLVPHAALSFAWALYAGLLLAVGFRLRHAPTRWTALGLFGVTLLKLLFYDLSELAGVYRVMTFFVAAVVLAAAAGAYRWVQLTHLAAQREVADD